MNGRSDRHTEWMMELFLVWNSYYIQSFDFIVNAESCHDSLEEKGVQLFQVLHLSPEKNKKVSW